MCRCSDFRDTDGAGPGCVQGLALSQLVPLMVCMQVTCNPCLSLQHGVDSNACFPQGSCPPSFQNPLSLGPDAARTILPPPWHTWLVTKTLSAQSRYTYHLGQGAGKAMATLLQTQEYERARLGVLGTHIHLGRRPKISEIQLLGLRWPLPGFLQRVWCGHPYSGMRVFGIFFKLMRCHPLTAVLVSVDSLGHIHCGCGPGGHSPLNSSICSGF